MHAGAHQLVDGALDGRQVGRQQRDAFAVVDLRQLIGKACRVGGVDAVGDLGDVAVPEVARGLSDLAFDQFEEGRLLGRQHVGEAEVGAARGPAGLLRRAQFFHHLHHPLHGLGVHAWAAVQHPVDRGGAYPGVAGDVGDGGWGGHA